MGLEVGERNFGTFLLGDDPSLLANGLMVDLAKGLGVVEVGTTVIDTGDYQKIVGIVGKNKVLRDNAELTALTLEEQCDFVVRSGLQNQADRSLWTPEISTEDITDFVIMGAVANWQDRVANLLTNKRTGLTVYSVAGNREMCTGTEVGNPNIVDYKSTTGRYPTESEYARAFVVPRLIGAGHNVVERSFDTGNGGEILTGFLSENRELLSGKISVARVANVGALMALQLRRAGRTIDSGFDSDPANPQVFYFTDNFPLARTASERSDALHYQNPQTALRQVAVTALNLKQQNPVV